MSNYEVLIGQKLRELVHIRRFRADVKNPAEAQKDKLISIIRRNEGSAFGLKHRFDLIKSVEDYQAQVPPARYEDLAPYIDAQMNGQKNQLTVESPLMFATTSGTTDKPKFIPITRAHLRDYTHAFQVHNYQMIADYPVGATGKFLIIASNDEEGRTSCGIPYGAVSGLLSRRQPAIIKKYFALPYQLAKVKDVDVKYYLMLRLSAVQNVTALLGCNPSSLLLLSDQMREQAARLVSDIFNGGLPSEYRPDEAVLDALRPLLAPNRTAARRLNRILEREGTLEPKNVWPDLALISCWKGGPMSFYLERLPKSFGGVPIRDFGYMASEGRGTIPLTNDGAGGVLAVGSHFFEFVGEDDNSSANPVFLIASELELDGRYYIYFTTASGLYRYNINDLVEVVGFHERTPVIQFVRKGLSVCSITGEKLTEEQVKFALAQSVRQLRLDQIAHFTAAVQLGEPPYYACFMELTGPHAELTDSLREEFLRKFEDSLMAQNMEYADKRKSKRLGSPVLYVVPSGTYTRLRQRRVNSGAPEAQVKIPLLARAGEFQLNKVGQLL